MLENRTREQIETTVRAGIHEQATVEVLSRSGASARVLDEGLRHDGIELRFSAEGHRIDFPSACGRSVAPETRWLARTAISGLGAGSGGGACR